MGICSSKKELDKIEVLLIKNNLQLKQRRSFNPVIPSIGVRIFQQSQCQVQNINLIINFNSHKSFFDFEINDIDGNLVQMSKFQGKKAYICVNVACSCRLTTQNYVELVEIYIINLNKIYRFDRLSISNTNKGLEILGFPCNQFRNQESKPEPEIKNYVTQKYGAHFPLFQKIEVNGIGAHDIYKYLRYMVDRYQVFEQKVIHVYKFCYSDCNSELRINNKNEVKYVHWNFAKFLLDGNGNVINYYCPDVSPNDMIKDIEKLLKN